MGLLDVFIDSVIIIFIGTAAWGGYVLAKNAHLKGAKSSVDPLEDRSLFGR